MARIWTFVSDPKTLAVLTLMGGAIAFMWPIVERHVLESDASPSATSAGRVAASSKAMPSSKGAPPKSALAPSQMAEADDGGNAINAGNNATITIADKKP